MPDLSLNLLARELGEVAGRIEREIGLRWLAIAAEYARRQAEMDRQAMEVETRVAALERAAAERLASLKDGVDGAPGRDGVDGAAGRDGINGERGEKGLDGQNGQDGAPGRDGIDGAPGRDGINGECGEKGLDGQDGIAGPQGVAGSPGKFPVVRDWVDQIHYDGDVVRYDGATWQARCDTGRPPPHEDWICLARAGRDGVDGASFRICGTMDVARQYGALDVVILNGGAFVAKRDDPGACPGDGWQLLASQGKQGKPGEKGPAGAKGDRGAAGPAIVGMAIDDDGVLTLTNADGSEVACDLYPLLSRLDR